MKMLRLLLVLVAVVALAGFALAKDEKDVTVTGKLVCAKCTLHEEGLKDCQNVIEVTADGKTTMYYIAKNKVSEEFGHVCKGEKNVVATGKVKEKDGKTWIDATKIEETKS